MSKRGHIKSCNSSLTQSLRELEKSSLDGLMSYLRADFPTQPTNLAQDTRIANALKQFASYKNAESSPFCHSKSFSCHSERSEESKNNPSLRDSAKQNRGNPKDLRATRSNHPPCEKMQKSQSGLPRRFCESARNDNFLDSSVAMLPQNNKNSARVAESALDSADFTTNAESANKAQQTIEEIAVEVAEFLGDFECKTGLKSAQRSKSPKSPQDAPKTKLQTQDELT